VIGLLIVAFSTYLMSLTTWDLSRESVMFWTSIRSVGYVVATVSVLTLGLAVVPTEDVDEANAWGNLSYRVTAALVLSVLNTIAAGLGAQLAVDYSPPRTALPPEVDPRAMLPVYEHFQVLVQAHVMDGLFFIVTLATLAGALLALALPTGHLATAQPPPTEPIETPGAIRPSESSELAEVSGAAV
jgi:hypothetical protein